MAILTSKDDLRATRREQRRPQRGLAQRRNRNQVLLFLSPWIIGFTLFFAYPLVATVYLSFTRFDLISAPHWVGLRNFDYMLHKDPIVWKAVGNTLWLVAVMVPTRILFALGVASLLIRIKTGANLFRTLFYLPSLAPPVAATIAFVFLFNPATGPVNHALSFIGIKGPLWFTDPSWSKPGLALLGLWGVGDIMIIFLAGLLNVPVSLYEAAELDGAGSWHRFRHVTLPTITPVLIFALVTGVIGTLQYFTQAVVAGGVAAGSSYPTGSSQLIGWPQNSTLTFPAWLYQQGFQWFNMGYASALALLLLVVAMAFTYLLLRKSKAFYAEEAAQ